MQRPAPPLTFRTGGYWRSGADGILRIARCQACGLYMHPPQPLCCRCYKSDIAFSPVSGRGTVHSYTINRYQWNKGMPPPYVIAEIELPEQAGLRILSSVINIDPEAVVIGMPVQVAFEQVEDTWIPLFHP